ncbi:hypothetical protein [Rhodococcus sp. BH5]|uniref:hypothetical protein n=1 Tax=Rhodococcus sp. BH5 TaxID=2871702 RepID=UPI0022CD6FC1|nr:hypothetical protein [Rhodococcus sp. BH5]MCZ9634858.1 hypothetical protein [Rhodococcus sp. BH5]
MADLHIIYTSYGPDYGWSLSSPQIPDLIGGRKTLPELMADTDEILEFAGADPDAKRWIHEQHHYIDPEGDEYLVRILDDDSEDRLEAANRLVSGVLSGNDADLKSRQPISVTTERILIAVVGSDTLGWVEEQLGPGAGATVGIYGGDDVLYSVPVLDGKLTGHRSWPFEKLGLTSQSLVADMLDAVLGKEAQALGEADSGIASRRLVHLP